MRSCRSSCARTSLAPTSRPHARLPKIDSVQPVLDSRIGCRRIHRRNATSAQAASTNPRAKDRSRVSHSAIPKSSALGMTGSKGA
jgi:hypothetical protein